MHVPEYFNDVTQLYLYCNRYNDSGLVKSEDRINKAIQTAKFQTDFKRDDYFHFE